MSIKVGDVVCFDVSKVREDGAFEFFPWPGRSVVGHPSRVVPIPDPAPDPHAHLVEDIRFYAINYIDSFSPIQNPAEAMRKLKRAVAAWKAAQRPPSQYAALRKAFDRIYDGRPGAHAEFKAELAKLEAEERKS